MRRPNWRLIWTLTALAFAAFVIGGIVLAGREPVPTPPNSADYSLTSCHAIGSRINSRSWSFDCKGANTQANGTIAVVNNVHDGVLFKNGKPYLRISANQIQINTVTFDFTAIGRVHIEQAQRDAPDRRSFDTDFVQWLNTTKTLLLPHPSLVRSGDEQLHVQSITVDFSKSLIHLGRTTGGVHVAS